MSKVFLVNANAMTLPLQAGSVHMVATSPPYWSLRDYGVAGQLGREDLHDCLAWARGEEPCSGCFVCSLRQVAAEVWRVLRDDGTFWLNLGDSYASGSGGAQGKTGERAGRSSVPHQQRGKIPAGMQSKNLVGIPWRVALALQADGWILRRDIIWHKGNAMPESVKDRPTSSHEYVFLLAKQPRYFYDGEAVKTPIKESSLLRLDRGVNGDHKNNDGAAWHSPQTFHLPRRNVRFGGDKAAGYGNSTYSGAEWEPSLNATVNLRDVWTVNTTGYPGAHFATWPEALVETMIKAGTSEHGVCAECGAPYKRVTEKSAPEPTKANPNPVLPYAAGSGHANGTGATTLHRQRRVATVGWQTTCNHHGAGVVPATVLDCFAGSGTTGVVARRLGRSAVLCDLSLNYLQNEASTRLGLRELERWQSGRGVAASEDDVMGLPLFAAPTN